MSSQREDLTFKMGLDADAFRRQLTRVNADVQKQSESMKGRLAEAFTLTAAALAFKEIGEHMVELRRKSDDLGVSIESLQGLEKLGAKFGGSAEQTDAALTKLTLAIGNARTEGGAAAESFARFGIELYNTNGQAKNTEEVFKDIANAYKSSSDASTKAALAFEFFGKTGKDINNILDLGSEGIEDYVAKSKGIGITAVENVNALADAWLKVKQSFTGTGVFANALGWITRVTTTASATLGALSGGVSLSDAQAIAGAQDAEQGRQEQERSRNQEALDRAARDAKQREAIAKAADSLAELTATGKETEAKRSLIKLTSQELALRSQLLSLPGVETAPRQVAARNKLLEVLARKGAEERRQDAGKLARMEQEARQIQHQIEWENDTLKRAALLLDLKKKQNEADAQRNALAEKEARQLEQRNRLQQDVRDVETKRDDRTKFTLAELAGANARGVGDAGLRADVLKAQQVARLQAEAERLRLRGREGDTTAAEKLFSQADAITSTIGSLRSGEKLNTIATEITKVNQAVQEWNKLAKGEGLKVQPVFAK